jgi:hypothetical protein
VLDNALVIDAFLADVQQIRIIITRSAHIPCS